MIHEMLESTSDYVDDENESKNFIVKASNFGDYA